MSDLSAGIKELEELLATADQTVQYREGKVSEAQGRLEAEEVALQEAIQRRDSLKRSCELLRLEND